MNSTVMATQLMIKNAMVVNEGRCFSTDVFIVNGRITHIHPGMTIPGRADVLDAQGKYLLPGFIDDQVHFREPGWPHKGTMASESRAAVAGGVTTFMEMPNVAPPTTTYSALAEKYRRAASTPYANYSFYFGATHDNLDAIRGLTTGQACGIKIFMGASTGTLLVDNLTVLEKIFSESPLLIATHCEDTPTIRAAEQTYQDRYGTAIPPYAHADIRSVIACKKSSALAVSLAKKYGARLHVLHLTTADELSLFTPAPCLTDLHKKSITAEVCIPHLFFNQQDYYRLGHLIKCNPAIKGAFHQMQLIEALKSGLIDVIGSDHAPHLRFEKQRDYFEVPSGMPLVQHSLLALLDLYQRGILPLELIVQKTSHAVAERFQLCDRGYIREGYWADLVLVNLQQQTTVSRENLLYHCGWSPFEGYTFGAAIDTTLVNGVIVFQQGRVTGAQPGRRLTFTPYTR